MSLCPLPLECLRLIFQVLFEQGHTLALQRLLQVNSFFLTAALPYLYQDPAYIPDFKPTNSLYHPHPLLFKCVQNILRQRPPEEITDLLNAAFDVFPEQANDKKTEGARKDYKNSVKKDDPQEQDQDEHQLQDQDLIKKRAIDYLSYTRIFDFEHVVFSHFNRDGRWEHPTRLLNYALKSSATGAMATDYGQGDHDQDLLFPPLTIMSAVLFSRYNLIEHLPVNMGHFRQAALATTIRRDLTWALCSPVMENVELLTIPLSDINRYLACISEFKSLVHVVFLMDEFLDLSNVWDNNPRFSSNNRAGAFGEPPMDGAPLDQDLEETKQALRAKRDQQVKTMFEFVKQHLVHFPKQLQQAECPEDSTWLVRHLGGRCCPQEILDELKSLLPAAKRVSKVDHTNLIQITNHIQETNLNFVKQIELPKTGDPAYSLMIANLKRCRGLKRFSTLYPGPEPFNWAVEERIAWDRYHAAVAAKAARIGTGFETKSVLSSVMPVPPPLPLVPLETIYVDTPTKRELDDIVFAFGASLKDLTAYVGPPEFHLDAHEAETANTAAGNTFTPVILDFRIAAEPCWSQLPALTKIELHAQIRVRIVIEPDFFASLGSCRTNGSDDQGFDTNHRDENDSKSDNEDNNGNDSHKLESLTIIDGSDSPYRCEDLQSCEPFLEQRPKMTHIELVGYPALVFHPDSLFQTPNLQELRLEQSSKYREWSFIPPVEELEASFRDVSGEALQGSNKSLSLSSTEPPAWGHRAAWTWDWRLPHLTLLHLVGEFAFLFKFQMLVGCPSLESLLIDISTREGVHKRMLSAEDFITKSSVSNGGDEQDQQSEVVNASSLKNLTLTGPWFLNDETIQVMYGGTLNRTAVFPKLVCLTENNISAGYSLKIWLALMQGLPDLKRADCGLYDQSQVGAEILKNNHGLKARDRWVTGPDGHRSLEWTVPVKDTKYCISNQYWSFPKDAADEILEGKE